MLRGKILFFSMLLAVVVSSSFAQQFRPEFSVDFVGVKDINSITGSRVDIYVQIPFTSLNFIATSNGFTADYQTTLSAIEIDDGLQYRNLVQTKYWESKIITDTYIETQGKDLFQLNTQSIELASGSYVFEMQISDNNSNQVLIGEFHVTVRDFSAPVSISDITLLESYDAESFSIVPLVDQRLTTADGGIQIFYETYSDVERELTIVREVLRIQKDAGVPELNGMLDTVVRRGVSASVEVREEELSILPAGRGQQVVRLSADDLKVGTYLVRVSLVDPVDGILDMAEKSFSTLWGGLDAHLEDIDNAISQLAYIAKDKDLKFIRDAQSTLERLDRFREFWVKRDPTPNTVRNERMEEYYYRVDSANRHYGAQQAGWKTDRGYIYVTYGEPDHIQRNNHSFDYEPHEVWVYERLGRQFIFVDKTGFGDFDLLLPAWDERTRLY